MEARKADEEKEEVEKRRKEEEERIAVRYLQLLQISHILMWNR